MWHTLVDAVNKTFGKFRDVRVVALEGNDSQSKNVSYKVEMTQISDDNEESVPLHDSS